MHDHTEQHGQIVSTLHSKAGTSITPSAAVHRQLWLIAVGLALAIEEQHGQACTGDEQAIEPAVEELKLQLSSQYLSDDAPAYIQDLGTNALAACGMQACCILPPPIVQPA